MQLLCPLQLHSSHLWATPVGQHSSPAPLYSCPERPSIPWSSPAAFFPPPLSTMLGSVYQSIPPPPPPPTIFFCAGVSIHNTHIYLSILVIGQSDKVVYQGKCPTSAGYCRQGLYVGQNAILYPSIKKTNQDSNWSWKLFVRLHVTGRQPWL